MDSKELIKAGKLLNARKQLVEEVKSSPGNIEKRTFLFQVLCFYGEWDKAENHLNTIAVQDPIRETGVQVYKNLIHAEKERVEVFKSNQRPSLLPQSPPYLEIYYIACEKLMRKELKEAQQLFEQIDSERPVLSGTINDKIFTGFKDTDTFVCFFLEAFVYDRYVWIPFESIRELSLTPPQTLFDLIWISARITTWEGLTTNCYLPVLYFDSSSHEDDRVKLGKMTDWTSLGEPFSKAQGQHVFEMDEEEISILEIREILFINNNIGEK